MENEENKKKRRYIILIIFLFIFLSVTLFSFSNIDKGEKEPSNITNPDKEEDKTNEEDSKDNNETINKPVINLFDDDNSVEIVTENKPATGSADKDDEEEELVEDVPSDNIDPNEYSVRDNTDKWEAETELKIFESISEEHVLSGKIAPGVKGEYYFTIRNNNDFSVNYSITFTETNEKNINMLYKLKKGDKYILGSKDEYVSIKSIENIVLDKNMMTNYTLSWIWKDSSNDTSVGLSGADYGLNIKVTAEEKV